MASSSIYIYDMYEAIQDGKIPGSFNRNKTVYTFPTIRSTSSRDAVLLWTVQIRLVDSSEGAIPITNKMLRQPVAQLDDLRGEITTESQQLGGKIRDGVKPTFILRGKNLGRKNATNVITQAFRDALSKYNHHLKQKKIIPATGEGAAGVVGDVDIRPPPMLVKKMGETRDATFTKEMFDQGIIVQRKYNGVRLVADGNILYSRTGSDYLGFDPIRKELNLLIASAPMIPDELLSSPVGCMSPCPTDDTKPAKQLYIDGEIWAPGKSLRYISGQARREDDVGDLKYYVFDCFWIDNTDIASAHRQKYLDLLFKNTNLKYIVRVENIPAKNKLEITNLAKQFVTDGYEGAIARKACAPYRYGYHNYHSSNLVKIKPLFDSEFTIVGYTQGTKGKDVGALIWICEVDKEHIINPADIVFAVVPKDMTYKERYHIFQCLGENVNANQTRFQRDFYGKPLTVEYPERSTKTGKPTQAKAITIRTYESGIENDPMKRLYEECCNEQAH